MTKDPRGYSEVTCVAHGPERRRACRKVCQKKLIEVIPGYFIDTSAWNAMSLNQRILEKIRAGVMEHPDKVLCSVSAAAVLGAVIWPRFYQHVHFATESYMSGHEGKSGLIMHHVISGMDMDGQERLEAHPEPAPELLRKIQYSLWMYQAITDIYGLFCGFLVTSPLQTMFDVARQLDFEFALAICDTLMRLYQITQESIESFLGKKRGCKGIKRARYVLGFVCSNSDNGGESYARARMILAGFKIPDLQVTFQNPFYSPTRGNGPTIQNTKTLRVDFCWNIQKKDGSTVRIVAELDGRDKYTNPEILESIGAKDEVDVRLKERDREGALTQMELKIVRFQFFEASWNDGEIMVRKLKIAGVPMVSQGEQRRRIRWLREYAQKCRLKFE